MSHRAVTWAWAQATGSPTRKAVLVALADRHNGDTGRCDPSIQRISEETEFSERSVRSALKDLEELGLIARDERRRADGSRRTYAYRFPQLESPSKQAAGGAGSQAAGGAAEPEVVLEPEVPLAPPAQNGRKPNPIWDALTAEFGEATTRTAQTLRGKIVRSLKEAGATPQDIQARSRRWPRMFPNAKLTEAALEKHWGLLAPPRPPPVRLRPGEVEITPEQRQAGVQAAKEGLRQLKGAK